MKNMRVILSSLMICAMVAPVYSKAADTNSTNEEIDRNRSSQGQVLYYTEWTKDGNNYSTNLYRRTGENDPERIGSVPGYPYGYQLSPRRDHIAFNYGKDVRFYDLQNNRFDQTSSPYHNVTGMTYSPDGRELLIWDYDRENRRYNAYRYDYYNRKMVAHKQGQAKNNYFPYAWRKDGKLIMVHQNNNREYIVYYDIENNQITQTNYINPYWISPDGQYMALGQKNQHYQNNRRHNLYDPRGFHRDSYSDIHYGQYRIIDPCSGTAYGSIGQPGRYNRITGYSASDNQIMYDTSRQYYASGSENSFGRDYFTETIKNDDRPITIENPEEIYRRWRTSSGVQINIYGNVYVIFKGNHTIARSNRPLGIIADYYDDGGMNRYDDNSANNNWLDTQY